MQNQMMWAYLIHLSTNMWDDPGCKGWIAPYRPTLATDEQVWRETVDFLPGRGFNTVVIDLGDAVQYESHPEIAIPGAWPKDKLKAELARMRAMGLTPIPKLNFSTCHDIWLGQYERMVSTPVYYQVCADLIAEVIDLFDTPPYFHLGMDEENQANQADYQYCCIRQWDLWWHDLYFLFDCCLKKGVRPWVWADPCWDNMDAFCQKMPKTALLSNWSYHAIRYDDKGLPTDKRYQAYLQLSQAGFDQVPTASTWSCWYNNRQTMELGKKLLDPAHLMGYMTAPWAMTEPPARYTLLNDAQRFFDAKQLFYPDAL